MGTKAKGEVGGTICAAGTNSRASGDRGIATATATPLQLLSVAPVVSRNVLYLWAPQAGPNDRVIGWAVCGHRAGGPFIGTAARAGRSARFHLHQAQVALPHRVAQPGGRRPVLPLRTVHFSARSRPVMAPDLPRPVAQSGGGA